MRSILIGTAGLSAAAAVGLLFALLRKGWTDDTGELDRLVRVAWVAVAVQSVHFLEELITGFHQRFPEFLGLRPWPVSAFVAINISVLAVGVIAVRALPSGKWWTRWPLWFLAIGTFSSGVVHPLAAWISRGYFPGLFSAPVQGLLGALLLVQLWWATASRAISLPRSAR